MQLKEIVMIKRARSGAYLTVAAILLSMASIPLWAAENSVLPKLVANGQSDYVVIIPDDPEGSERFAADEFIRHLRSISDCRLPLLRESQYGSGMGAVVSIGRTERSRQVIDDKAFAELGDEGYLIQTDGADLIITGGRRHGSMYGVYEYLESLGIRWLTTKYTHIPKCTTIDLKPFSRRVIPKVFCRDQQWNNWPNTFWYARMRLNGEYARLPKIMGGSMRVKWGCHSYTDLVPTSLYKEHPEWFSMKQDGKRHPGIPDVRVDICATNPELRSYILNKVRKDLRTDPDIEQYWVSQSDGGHSGCFCPACSAERVAHGGVPTEIGMSKKTAEYGGHSGMGVDSRQQYRWSANIISLANYVARGVRDEFPNVKIKTLAYSYTWTPPENMTLEDNVMVVLCGPNPDWFLPYETSCPDWREALLKWIGMGGIVETYMYGGSNYGYWWPFPNWLNMCRNIQTAYHDGVRSLYRQGAAAGYGSGFVELRAYLNARMNWDPERDYMKDFTEFTDLYYGPGAPYIRDYILWFDKYISDNQIIGNDYWRNADGWRKYMTPELVETSDAFFQKALDATREMPEFNRRVRAARLPSLFAKIMFSTLKQPEIREKENDIVLIGGRDYGQVVKDISLFTETMRENGYNRWNEKIHYNPKNNDFTALAVRHPLRILRNQACTVYIAPTLGGRIIRWNISGINRNILHPPSSNVSGYPFAGGYEEYSQFKKGSPGSTAEFKTIKFDPEAGLLVLHANLSNGLDVTRTFTLEKGSAKLCILSVYVNKSSRNIEAAPRAHPEFDYNLFHGCKLFAWEKPGEWERYDMVTPTRATGQLSLAPKRFAGEQGRWLLGNIESNWGLLNTFDLETPETLYAYYGENEDCMTLEIWGKARVLEPQDSAELKHTYEFIPDLRSYFSN